MKELFDEVVNERMNHLIRKQINFEMKLMVTYVVTRYSLIRDCFIKYI